MNVLSVLLLSTVFTSSVFAGGISGGGGGTTNPKPSTPNDVGIAVYEVSSKAIIKSWFNANRDFYDRLGEGQKLSPFYKIFSSDKNLDDVLDNTKIELRMSQPCYDRDGAPKDGSVVGTVMKGAICLSAFNMAPKLNENNVREETLALMVHEISHYFGTTEEEAVEIQQRALWTFNKIDFLDAQAEMKDLVAGGVGSDGQQINFYFDLFSSALGNAKKYNWMWEDAKNHLSRFRDRLRYGRDKLLFADHNSIDMVTAQFARVDIVEDYMCANNPNIDETSRLRCSANLSQAFGLDKQVTAAQLLTRRDPEHTGAYPAAFEKVIIHKIETDQDAQIEMKAVSDFIKQQREEIFKMIERGQFYIYNN